MFKLNKNKNYDEKKIAHIETAALEDYQNRHNPRYDGAGSDESEN